MQRRTALKIIALGALSATLTSPDEAAGLWSPDSYELRFFSEAENDLVDQLMETIIPADSHSAGAHAVKAGITLYCPAVGDSSIGIGIAENHHLGKSHFTFDVIGDVLETAPIASSTEFFNLSREISARDNAGKFS